MRGEVLAGGVGVSAPWITPAHAGRRKLNYLRGPLGQDHPRACGEKYV